MSSLQFEARDESDTERLGKAIASALEPGCVVALIGPLGAGKTRLVRAIAAALGVAEKVVTSPTFVLVNEYHGGRLPIYHFDAYRLKDLDEFAELGPDEYFFGAGVTFVEWADRVSEYLPAVYLRIDAEVVGTEGRQFTLSGSNESMQRFVDAVRSNLAAT